MDHQIFRLGGMDEVVIPSDTMNFLGSKAPKI